MESVGALTLSRRANSLLPVRQKKEPASDVKKQYRLNLLQLHQLEDLLPNYCQGLAACQYVKCCSFLGSILLSMAQAQPVPPAASPIFRPATPFLGRRPPRRNKTADSSPTGKSPSTSPKSPIRMWMTGDAGAEDENQTANPAAETYDLAPSLDVFFLLVGVEAMYTSMAHAISSPLAQLLVNCYERVIQELESLRFTLASSNVETKGDGESEKDSADPGSKNSSGPPLAVVTSLASTLLSLVSYCQVRIQCVQLQSALWHPQQPTSNETTSSTLTDFAELEALLRLSFKSSQIQPPLKKRKPPCLYSLRWAMKSDRGVDFVGRWTRCNTPGM